VTNRKLQARTIWVVTYHDYGDDGAYAVFDNEREAQEALVLLNNVPSRRKGRTGFNGYFYALTSLVLNEVRLPGTKANAQK